MSGTTPYFEPVSGQVEFPGLEEKVLSFWENSRVFEKSLEQTKKGNAYVFYDGPPFATGLPHYGHLLAGTIKDIIPRYWTMRGRYVERRFGWDCHGLPVENEMEKELKVSGKREIEKMGLHIFNEACRSIVLRYTEQWETIVRRMGRWVDFVHQYRTMDPTFMESIWWVFRQVWDKGLIYQGYRVQPYCPRCTTPLSNFEVNEGYKDVKNPSITVAFPLADDPATRVLVWTTTPWTLPSNVVLAVGPKIRYVKVRDGDVVYLLAKDRLAAYYKKPEQYTLLSEMDGAELAGLRYTPMYEYFAQKSPDFFRIVTADFVSTEDGTGVVHIAPAFGEDDFGVGARLGLPIVCPVDEEGRFTAEVPAWEGKLVFDADEAIVADLKKRGRLIHKGVIEHRYPFCYRCDTALIQKAITTWFLKVDPIKDAMIANNQTIHWVPDHLRDGRFGNWLAGARDWNIARNRYWGTPIPIWKCPSCGRTEVVGGLSRLHELAGGGNEKKGREQHAKVAAAVRKALADPSVARTLAAAGIADPSWAEKLKNAPISDTDLHRHVVDELKLACPKCKTEMKRTPEVLDCWFESGSMPYAQSHYPFENRAVFEAGFPADFIAEGLDQTRGWFYTLIVLSAALFGKPAFKNVVVNGIILSEDGKKLSKRLRNYEPPEEVLNKLGADALRLFLINSPAVRAEDLRFSEKGILEMSKAVLLPFWNAYSFFVTYANVDGWKPSPDLRPKSDNELDRWIVSLLNNVIRAVNREMEQYNLYRVVPNLVDFIDNLTNWYIRRSRRRFWKSENDGDKQAAYATLYYVLVNFSRAMAPFLPFLTETIWRNLVAGKVPGQADSVHLAAYPQADLSYADPDLEMKMALVRRTVVMGRTLRSRFTIKNRQPLRELTVIVKDAHCRELLSHMESLIKDELNVKQVRFDENEDSVVTVSAKANFRKLGKLFGPRMKEAAALIEKLAPAEIHALSLGGAVDVLDRAVRMDDIELRRAKHAGIEVETDNEVTVALDTEITPELASEGLAREFVNRVQVMRKARNLAVTDRIAVTCACPAPLAAAVEQHAGYVRAEVLAVSLSLGAADPGSGAESFEIDDIAGKLAIAIAR